MTSCMLSDSSPTMSPGGGREGDRCEGVKFWELNELPGEPPNTLKGGTTVSGGNTVLSRIRQQSFRIHDRDCIYMERKNEEK